MAPQFTAHNIRLDDGTSTKPEAGPTVDQYPRFIAAKKLLENLLPGERSQYRIADLGCLDGGYAVEFARLGYQVLGVEVRESNIANCRYVQSKTSLPNLDFAHDDAWKLEKYGRFDVVFCCGLFYHLDRPSQFLKMLSRTTGRVMILQTHFAEAGNTLTDRLPLRIKQALGRFMGPDSVANYSLSPIAEHDGLKGRWYLEFGSDSEFKSRDKYRESSWDNRKSFWVQREYLLQAIADAGFEMVFEQFDDLRPDIAKAMFEIRKFQSRGTFVGIKGLKPDSSNAR